MTETPLPKGVSTDTLRQIIAGWYEAGADEEPRYTSAVEDETGIADAVGRQTRFLEDTDILTAEGQKHRLTEQGEMLAKMLAEGEEGRARGRARDILSNWEFTNEIEGILRKNPTEEESLVPLIASAAGQDIDDNRVRNGVTTLIDLYEWSGMLERDEQGRYRLPPEKREPEAVEGLEEVENAVGRVAADAEEAAGRVESVEKRVESAAEEMERVETRVEETAEKAETAVEEAERAVGIAEEV